MSITDELREWANGNSLRAGMSLRTARDQALAIADRIDKEYEDELQDMHNVAYAKGFMDAMKERTDWASWHEDEMAEYGWVRLPVDADGVPIRVGDVMKWPTTGETFEVVGIGDGVLFYVEDGSEQADWTGASTKRHYHAPTVEDVMVEFATDWESAQDGEDKTAVLKEYAKRLTLAGKDE